MQKTDKLFVALIVLSLGAFWVIIAPAGFSSQISDAAPVTVVEKTPVIEPKQEIKPVVRRSVRQRPVEPQLTEAQLARLKRRNTDSPPGVTELMRQRIEEPVSEVRDPNAYRPNLTEAPGYRQLY